MTLGKIIMTTLAAWITYSQTGEKPELPRALYMASDSRITWGSKSIRWDAGRKVFNPKEEPHIFGYCGDVVFPSLALGQIILAIDNGVLFDHHSSPAQKHESIIQLLKNSFANGLNHPARDFSILHAYRESPWPHTEFHIWQITYRTKNCEWDSQKLSIPKETGIIVSLGSGAPCAQNHREIWSDSDAGGTSRSYFSALCDAIASGGDPFSGGAPQLCALYPTPPPKSIGVIKDDRYFLHGIELQSSPLLSKIEWKDELFRDIDPKTKKVKDGARKFAKPRLKTKKKT